MATGVQAETARTRTEQAARGGKVRKPLYTPEQRARRNATKWTLVQGILAPIQFLVFAVSLFLVLRFLATGEGLEATHLSIIVKTVLLFTIMVTGSIWEKVVFDVWLFAEPFFWEDVFSFLVIFFHCWYLYGLFTAIDDRFLMYVTLAAYVAYVINATQWILKLRAARLLEAEEQAAAAAAAGAGAAA
ncbi:MAG: 2-vinyl bacteriochlorophyllide hydratase [Gemmatimonadaceae bacterium]|jgi:3-vinyl bacteriochlorophyllide hydratase|nr:2-vinyl bacteriochlorophyllide hydratase [Gemmatimonadaceae bacterium]